MDVILSLVLLAGCMNFRHQDSTVAGAASVEELHQLSMLLAGAGPQHCWEHLSIIQLGFAAAAAGAACEGDRWRFLATCHRELLQACATGTERRPPTLESLIGGCSDGLYGVPVRCSASMAAAIAQRER